jgi:hypothetical protein
MKNYEEELKKMLAERMGGTPRFLSGSIEVAAKNWEMLDHIHKELMAGPLTKQEEGYNGQDKSIVHPLLPYYDKLQRTLLTQFEALGLNFRAAPKKMTEPTEICAKGDPIDEMLGGMP